MSENRCNLRALCQTLYVWKAESYFLSAKLDGQKPRKFENTPLKQRCVFRLSGLQGPKNLYKQVSNGQRAQDISIELSVKPVRAVALCFTAAALAQLKHQCCS